MKNLVGGISTGNGSVLNVVNSTIAGNIAEQGGGAIAVPSGFSATITIANATLINNSERSGFDGGGLSVPSPGAEPIVKNSIIANNTSTGFGVRNTLQTITSQGYNISDDLLQGSPTAAGDQFNTSPGLSAVSANGVAVPTNSSAAIDRGNPAGCTDQASAAINTDQRGNARNDLRCDVGAVEFVFADGDTVIKSVAVGTTESFGPTLAQITRTAGGSDPGAISIRKVAQAPGPVQESGEMPVQWRITPAGSSSGLTIDLGLCYTAAELAAAPGATAGTLNQYRFVMAGSPWTLIGADSRPAAANGNTCVIKNGVTQLSWWTLASVAPTAVSLQQLTIMHPQLIFWVMAAVAVVLLLSSGWVVLRQRRS